MNEDQINENVNQEQDLSAREQRRQEIESIFKPDSMKVVRKELFPSPRDPAVVFRNGNITFNAACIKALEGVVYVKLMFDENVGLFSVTGCDQNEKHALRWCVAKKDKRSSRRMRCPDFTDSVYEHFGWDKKCRYKFLGYPITYNGKLYFVFDLTAPQIFREKPKKGEEPLNDKGEPIQIDTRKGYFPDDIAHTFGVPMEQYKKETEVIEMDGLVEIAMFTGVRDKGANGEKQDNKQPGAENTDSAEPNAVALLDPEQLVSSV